MSDTTVRAAASNASRNAAPAPLDDTRALSLLRSPLAAVVLFLATAVGVCADPIIALTDGAGQWAHDLSPSVVVSLAALGCLAQAIAVTWLAARPLLALSAALGCYLAVALPLAVPTWATPMQLVVAVAMFRVGAAYRAPWAAVATALVVTIAAAAFGWWALDHGAPAGAAISFIVTEGTGLAAASFAGVALGGLWSVTERRARAARNRARDLEREQQAAIEASRNAERGRIAQELHDVAGQHLAGLVSLCDASVQLAPAQPHQALRLIEEVRSEGRYAAASLYGALGDLRSVDAAEQGPTPDLRDVDELAAFWRERGMAVAAEVIGDVESPPAVVSTTGYRAVSEALSNAAKHAPGASVHVTVDINVRSVEISVLNTSPSRLREDEEGLGLGWGLDNLRQKLTLVDGELSSSATGGGGWHLGVSIPLPKTEAERD